MLRHIALGKKGIPPKLDAYTYASACVELKELHFAKVAFVEGGDVEATTITNEGIAYLAVNPHLHNPVDWSKVNTIVMAILTLLGLLLGLIACTKLL